MNNHKLWNASTSLGDSDGTLGPVTEHSRGSNCDCMFKQFSASLSLLVCLQEGVCRRPKCNMQYVCWSVVGSLCLIGGAALVKSEVWTARSIRVTLVSDMGFYLKCLKETHYDLNMHFLNHLWDWVQQRVCFLCACAFVYLPWHLDFSRECLLLCVCVCVCVRMCVFVCWWFCCEFKNRCCSLKKKFKKADEMGNLTATFFSIGESIYIYIKI